MTPDQIRELVDRLVEEQKIREQIIGKAKI
jgi:hypothetical protein